MSVNDIRSNLRSQVAMLDDIVADGDTFGSAIDVAMFDGGFMFNFFANGYTDGIYTPAIEESVDSGFSSPIEVNAERLIGIPANEAITGVSVAGDIINSLGAIGTLRFVRLKIAATSVTVGANIVSLCIKKGEISPVNS